MTRIRAGLLAALMLAAVASLTGVPPFPVVAARADDKPWHRDDLAAAAVRLEAEIKREVAGVKPKPLAALRGDADKALARKDQAGAVPLLRAIAALASQDAINWLRLAKATMAVPVPDDDAEQRSQALENAGAAAWIAYQRALPGGPQSGTLEPETLATIGTILAAQNEWRGALDALHASLGLREVLEVRDQYDRMRAEHGFRFLSYSVDSDAAAPRACFQFSESLPGNTDYLAFVGVAGHDKPALSVDGAQLCVEGLQHGERYQITLRAGLPSVVADESLPKTADYAIYVRDRSPAVHFTTRAYVLPRSGQRGIPLVSINTAAIALKVYRIGDRNLLGTVVGGNFQQSLTRYDLERLGDEGGTLVWSGELAAESPRNAEVTTAFPVDEALGTLAPGVYAMAAEPAQKSKDDDVGTLASQWFIVSDLGLSALSGADGIHVFANSLASTEPASGTEVRLIARNNEVLAARKTDASGHVAFEPGLARGEGGLSPALLVATGAHDDYAFLSLKGPAFDFADRGVDGRAAPAGLDAFVATERGVYRTGETVHVAALLRDAAGAGSVGLPLTLVVERPDGVEYRRAVTPDQGAGGRSLNVALAPTAGTGTWTVKAYADPKRPPIGATTFLVEDYVPDRTEFTLTTTAPAAARGKAFEVAVDGRFLYGAPASDMELSGSLRVEPARGRAGYDGYTFGTAAGEGEGAVDTLLENLPATDKAGKAKFNVTLDKLPEMTRPLQAQVTVAMAESGGRAVERRLTLPVMPAGAMIGVKPLFAGGDLGENDTATFDAVVAAPDGASIPAPGLRWDLFRIEHRYQWYRHGGSWYFDAVKQTKRIANGNLDLAGGRPGRIAQAIAWGRYRLEVSSPDGSIPTTAVSFDAGFYGGDTADTPDLLETALDKDEYAGGDDMTVAVTAKTRGTVRLDVVTDRLVASVSEKVRPGVNRVRVPVGRDWGNGGYVVATLLRPLDEAAKRMPGRAIGVRWFSIDRKARTLRVAMTPEPLMRPGAKLRVPVTIDGLAAGEEARLVVAAVDVGILNLTGYKPPAPEDFYLGQRRLAAEVRDLYGQLIDGMQATRGQIRSGGDALARFGTRPPAGPPLALYTGVVTVARDGTAEVSFDIPEFAGTVRLMAMAWSQDRVGHGTFDVTVRDPLVATTTLPRFLLTGDRGTMQVEVDNVEGPAGDYRVEIEASGPVSLASAGQTMKLGTHERRALPVALTAQGAGDAGIALHVAGPGGFELRRSYHLAVKPANDTVTRRTVRSIAAGESVTLTPDLFADFVPGTGSVALSVGPSTALDAATLLAALERYPFACSEQLTSRALPLLYAGELSSSRKPDAASADDASIRAAVERLLTRQDSTGSFGLWSPGGDDPWLDSYVTDFLTRARERGFPVPDTGFRLALDRLRNFAVNASEPVRDRDGGRALAYAMYVLARNGMAPLGDLRYLADAKLGDIATPIARAQIGSALGILGDRVRAERVYAAAFAPPPKTDTKTDTRIDGRIDFGSPLRDAAAVMTLEAEGGAPAATIAVALRELQAARAASGPATSTQEDAWMVMAARAFGRDRPLSLQADGEAVTRALYRNLTAGELTARPFRLANTGTDAAQVVVSVSGAPVTPEPAAAKGFKLDRRWYTLDGNPADATKARQNQRLVVVLEVTEEAPQYGHVVVADYLPAGFEIDNPRLVSSGSTRTLAWIANAAEPANAEFRDDHFAAAFDRTAQSPAVFAVAYVVRVVSPGTYVLPQARVEDMYRPDRYGHTATGTVTVTAAR